MIERILGVDLGISSLGWAVVEYDKDNETNNKIIDCGVRLFTAAETPKEKESPNKARREARGIRRIIKRRRVRMNEIKRLCQKYELIDKIDLLDNEGMFHSNQNRTDVWELRHDALYRTLTGKELARVLIHIAKHRGYKFLGDDESDDESGKVKKAGAALKDKFYATHCQSIGEWLWKERGKNGKKRNKSGDYEISIPRDFLVDEIQTIFDAQRCFGNCFATQELQQAYTDIAFYVRPMQSIEHMVGKCTYFPEEPRAPKASPTAEQFVALGKFYTTVVIDKEHKEQKISELTPVKELMEFAISKEKLTYKELRKFLALDDKHIFKGLAYKPKKAKKEEDKPQEWEFDKAEAEKKVWINLKGHAKFKETLGDGKFLELLKTQDLADEVAKVLTYHKDERAKKEELAKLHLEASTIEKLSKISFTDFNQLSLKAMKAILPEMQKGKRYDEAIGILGKPTFEKSRFLPPLKETNIAILNPTVIRAFAQFRKVANALVDKYGAFDKVHFELAREVNTKGDIEEIKEAQRKNEKERESAKVWISENFGASIPVTRKNILKKRLYEQQDGRCAYTGEVIALERLFDEGYCEIDHILPRSRSGDDSFANKVLCLATANQNKRNLTPFEWFGNDTAKWNYFEARISSPSNFAKMGKGKISRLLKKNFDENSQKEFLARNLNDTRYMSKAIKTYCENYWKLSNDDDKLRIQVRSGKLTSTLRHQWGLDSKNRDTHTHHAMDAIMIAFSTQSMVKKLSDYFAKKEKKDEKEKPVMPTPMNFFKEEVEKATALERQECIQTKAGESKILNRLLISRPPRASVTGAAHKETIQSPKEYKGRGVKVNEGKGMCDNGDMPRVDVFLKDGKYYLVPIYVADFAKGELPNRAIVALKPYEQWEQIDESFEFLFSLHKEDLVELKTKQTPSRPSVIAKGYVSQVVSSTAQIIIENPDNIENEIFSRDKDKNGNIKGDSIARYGTKTLIYLKKYTIDPLGYYHEVKGEKRLGAIPQEAKKHPKRHK